MKINNEVSVTKVECGNEKCSDLRKRKSVVGGKTRNVKFGSNSGITTFEGSLDVSCSLSLRYACKSICEQPWRLKTLYCLLVTALASEDGVLLIAFDL